MQNCDFVSLSDLKTQSGYVRGKIAGYLNDLIGLGVDGFRIDAAKHIDQGDFAAVKGALDPTVAEGKPPYIAQEVFPGASNPDLKPAAFTSNGDVLGFAYAMGLKTQFQNGTLANLADIPSWSLDADGSRTHAMVTNHDTERDGITLSYKDGDAYTLANYFLLAYPYGKPSVFDGFTWSSKGQSPPADSRGLVTDTDCSAGWQCLTLSTGSRAWSAGATRPRPRGGLRLHGDGARRHRLPPRLPRLDRAQRLVRPVHRDLRHRTRGRRLLRRHHRRDRRGARRVLGHGRHRLRRRRDRDDPRPRRRRDPRGRQVRAGRPTGDRRGHVQRPRRHDLGDERPPRRERPGAGLLGPAKAVRLSPADYPVWSGTVERCPPAPASSTSTSRRPTRAP